MFWGCGPLHPGVEATTLGVSTSAVAVGGGCSRRGCAHMQQAEATHPDARLQEAAQPLTSEKSTNSLAETCFRRVEKAHMQRFQQRRRKQQAMPADLSTVLDVRAPPAGDVHVLQLSVPWPAQLAPATCSCTTRELVALTLPSHPGLAIFPDALPATLQLALMSAALKIWPEPPTRTNHTAAHGNTLRGLFAAAQAGLKLEQSNSGMGVATDVASAWRADGGSGLCARLLLRRLRWASLGPPYNWSTRMYEPDVPHAPLPPELSELGIVFAAAAAQASGTALPPAYAPEVALVNYYHGMCVVGDGAAAAALASL